MAGLLSPAPEKPTDSGVDFNLLNLKQPNVFEKQNFLSRFPNENKATASSIENLALAIPEAFTRFAISSGDALGRVGLAAYGMTNLPGADKARQAPNLVTEPTRAPGVFGLLPPTTTYLSDYNKNLNQGESVPKAFGKTALDVATDEPAGFAFKPLFAGAGLIAKAFGRDALNALSKEKVPENVVTLLKKQFPNAPEGAFDAVAPKIAATTDKKEIQSLLSEATKSTATPKLPVPEGKKATLPPSQERQAPRPSETTLPKLPKTSAYESDVKNLANEKVNVEHFNVSPEGKAIIERTVEEVKPTIQAKVGKVLSNKEALQLADKSSKVLSRAIGREETLAWQAANLRSRQALAAASKSGTVDESYVKNLINIKTQASDIARKLQSLSIGVDPKDLTGKQAILEAVIDAGNKADEIIKAAEGVDFTDLKQATDFYRKFVKPTANEWLDLIRYNSMLSSPKTHIVNVFSNLLNTTLVAPIEKALTGGLDFLGSKITGKARSAFAGESGAYLKGYFKNVSDAAQRFADVMRGTRKYTNLDTRNLPIATSGAKGKAVGALSFPLKLLEASDQFFTALAEGGETGSLQYRASKGVNVGNIESQAQSDAAYRLFRQDLYNENQGMVLDAVDQLTGRLQSLRSNKNPIVSTAAKFTVPFLKTPMNIFKQGIEYSPAGFATIAGAKNKTQQLSKAIIGSSIFAGAATLLMSNRLTWGEPTDPTQKQVFRASGMQPYSVKIGNKWVSYQKLPPGVAFPLAMVAAIDDTIKSKNIDDNTVDLVLSSVAKYGEFLADQSYAKSIGDLLAAAKGGESGIEKVASNYVQQFVPYRALGGWLARLFDTTQRKVDSSAPFIDQQVQLLMLNIPWLSQKVPARTDSSGSPIPQQSPVGNAFSPVQFSSERDGGSPEFQRLMDIQRANKQTSYNSKQKANQVESELNKIDSLHDVEEKKAYLKEVAATQPDVAKKVIQALKDRKKNLSASDQKLLNAATETRARFIVEEMDKMKTDEERKTFLKDLAQKKILTQDTLKEVIEMRKK